MRIRGAEAQDLPSILAAENACFSRDVAFPPETVTFLLDEAMALVVEDGDVVGFVIGFVNGEWGKVVTLDVLPERRGEGLGKGLMVALEGEFASQGARASLLEVAVDNRGALNLYTKLGYAKAGLVKDYYGPGKAALLMMKRLEEARPQMQK